MFLQFAWGQFQLYSKDTFWGFFLGGWYNASMTAESFSLILNVVTFYMSFLVFFYSLNSFIYFS